MYNTVIINIKYDICINLKFNGKKCVIKIFEKTRNFLENENSQF